MPRDLISVIIPVYNGAAFLSDAVNAVLRQTLPPHEVIVVDDGSTDGSAMVARGFGEQIDLVCHTHKGPGAARIEGSIEPPVR